MSDSIFSDDFKAHPFWWDETPRPESDQAAPPEKTVVLVIGSGYTGLHCALETARGGMDTLVIDAQTSGWGCSSRNGGHVSGEIKPDYDELAGKYGADKAFDLVREARNALEWISEFVRAEDIHCNFIQCGRYHGAHNPRQFRRLVEIASNQPRGLEQPLRIVERKDQASEIDSDFYHGGLVIGSHCSIDPAKYHQGLLKVATDNGVRVVSLCQAVNIERISDGFRVTTSKGKIDAKKVVIATSGYTETVTPWQRRRLIPIGSYMLATEQLAPARVSELMPKDRVYSDTRKLVVYYRRSPDGTRILFGGRVSVFESDPVKSAPALRQEMLRIFPQLEDAKLSHAWMGFVGFTFDFLPHLGKQDGLYYAMGYCGSGICLASYFGNRLGMQVLGRDEGKIAFNDLKFQSRPLYTGKPWFLGAIVRYHQLRDRIV
ncbi:MAG: FAD-binding oxidoreductase [Proteobacteria bacterium]|nr:FAD-binding oxidoreductase [Pseudomonadota bacterium]